MNWSHRIVNGIVAVVVLVAVGLGASAATRNTIDAELRAGCAAPGAVSDRLVRVKDRLYHCQFVRDATDDERK